MKYLFLVILMGASSASAEEAGRWTVIPATVAPVVASGTQYLFAWRLDNKTGALEMCTYDPGGWMNPVTKRPASEELTCSAPNKP